MYIMASEENFNNGLNENSIISIFIDDVLNSEAEPKNVYSFCKKHKIEEPNFYSFFGSIKVLKERIWVKFLDNVKSIIDEDGNFSNYSEKDKLLTIYFSLFEIFTLNRSYILFTLETEKIELKNILQLKAFRKEFKSFIEERVSETTLLKNEKISAFTKPIMSEGSWLQFLFILKFWMDDSSPNFEKTDVLIEKWITTTSLFLDNKPLESLFDLAKFLFKEKM